MGAYKQFLASDIVVTPFEVNKAFYFEGAAALTASGVGIDRFLGTNITGAFNPTTAPTTGQVSTQYQSLIYNSIKELYYTNYLSSSYGDNVTTASLIPGADEAGDRYVGFTQTPNYFNYLQTTLTYQRYFPTGSGDIIGVISIPSRLFGDYIQPKSFTINSQETISSDYIFVRPRSAEFNYSENPSFISGSTGEVLYPSFINNPQTYITTVGLYNDTNELLAVAKLSRPLLKDFTKEALIRVKLDF